MDFVDITSEYNVPCAFSRLNGHLFYQSCYKPMQARRKGKRLRVNVTELIPYISELVEVKTEKTDSARELEI